MALKLLATFLSVGSNLLNLADVVDVTRRNNPFPTIDADIYAFRSLRNETKILSNYDVRKDENF